MVKRKRRNWLLALSIIVYVLLLPYFFYQVNQVPSSADGKWQLWMAAIALTVVGPFGWWLSARWRKPHFDVRMHLRRLCDIEPVQQNHVVVVEAVNNGSLFEIDKVTLSWKHIDDNDERMWCTIELDKYQENCYVPEKWNHAFDTSRRQLIKFSLLSDTTVPGSFSHRRVYEVRCQANGSQLQELEATTILHTILQLKDSKPSIELRSVVSDDTAILGSDVLRPALKLLQERYLASRKEVQQP